MKSFRYSFTILLISFLLFSSCKKKGDESGSPVDGVDRSAMLIYIADEVILPSYTNFKGALDTMVVKSDAFTANPTTVTLIEFRSAWQNAYINWQKVELFDVGPAETYGLRFFFNIYPATINENATLQGIMENIENGNANLNIAASYSAQGFSALDYLLNGTGSTDVEIVSYYTTATNAAKRLSYIKKVTEQMKNKFANVYNQWNTSYRERFITRTGTDISSSTSLLVNGLVLHYERYLRSGKFGIPSGAMSMSNGAASSTSVEAYYSKEIAKTLAQTAHKAYVDFFNGKSVLTGTEGPSLKTYLNALDAKDATTKVLLSETINTQFALVNDKLALLTTQDLSDEVLNNNGNMKAVYDAMQKAVRMLKVDMTSATSVTITYTDNDGD